VRVRGVRAVVVSSVLSILSTFAVAGFESVATAAGANSSKQRCVDDNAAAQDLRRSGKFAAASERLRRCATPSCPTIVRDDCARRLDDLERVQPSVVFDVRDPSGGDVVAVRIRVDGTVLTARLEGTPLEVDPGPHVFTFEVSGQPVVTKDLVVREGEVGRHERVVVGQAQTLSSGSSGSAASGLTSELPREAQARGPNARHVVGLSLAGAGAVSAVVGVVFGLAASSAWSEAKRLCGGAASSCGDAPAAERYHSRAQTDATLSTVAFVAGGALLAGGAFLYFTGADSPAPPNGSLAVAPSLERDEVGVVLHGAFW
jgi:hypothetical protein